MSSQVTVGEAQLVQPSVAGPVGPPLAVPVARARTKGLIDLTLSLIALLVFAPLMLLVAIAIKLDSRGPVLFVQERIGVRRRRVGRWIVHEPARFRFYKFRSMVHGADPALHEAHIQGYLAGARIGGASKARFKLANDPRITRVGRFIRRTSIDELPQLLHVLRREMSLVGPRPVPVYEGNHYLERFPERFGTLPGITGLWQVSGRCDLSAEEMTRLDLEYVRRQSLRLDAKILLRTIPAVASTRGAG